MKRDIENLRLDAIHLEKSGEFRLALEKYQEIAQTNNADAEVQFKIAELHHQLGELPAALSAYLRVTDLDSNHKKANVKIEMIRSIMNYFNKDMINP